MSKATFERVQQTVVVESYDSVLSGCKLKQNEKIRVKWGNGRVTKERVCIASSTDPNTANTLIREAFIVVRKNGTDIHVPLRGKLVALGW